jgi:succinate-acetate transporter protein
MTLSLSMMGARGVENEGMFIADLLLLAGLGLIITAQWEMVRGNTFSYTVLSAFGKASLPLRIILKTQY